jgi:hypothetical protein
MTAPPQAKADWDRAFASHADLSPVDVRFRQLALEDPELLRGVAADQADEDGELRSPRQPWPLFISSRRIGEIAEAAVAVSRLFRSIPERLFNNDPDRLAAFFGWDPAMLRIALEPPNGIADGMSRGDFILGDSGFQCAEFNFGGNLGGFDNGRVARKTLGTPAIRSFVAAALGGRVRHRNTFRLLTRHLVRRALSTRISGGEVNAALVQEADASEWADLCAFFAREYEAVLAAIGPPLCGRLFICRAGDLTARGNVLERSGTRLHIVVDGDTSLPDPTIVRCFKAGNLLLYNGPTAALISDKRNLALLSENGESDVFTAEERAVIARHIPWSRVVAPGSTMYQGERHALERLTIARRESFVLKKGLSHSGSDVILGRGTSPQEWERSFERGAAEGDWIVQEYVESRPYLFQHREGCAIHRVVWGPYVFGQEFGGMFLRVQPEVRGGIVNASLGATHSCLLEVEDPPGDGPPS